MPEPSPHPACILLTTRVLKTLVPAILAFGSKYAIPDLSGNPKALTKRLKFLDPAVTTCLRNQTDNQKKRPGTMPGLFTNSNRRCDQ
jgi:hypothetical protein